jgi:protein TonB
LIQQRVNAAKEYPSDARLAGLQGQVRVSFTVGRNGQPGAVSTVASSGQDTLDQAAAAAIRKAAPFLPFPQSVRASVIRVTVTVAFRLK